jgi:putative PIN family toxin of toxin-antitoxin system
MLPLRLLIDTNILISAALKPGSLPNTALVITLTKPARLYISPAILAEYRTVLARPELRIRKGLRRQLLQLIESRAHLVTPIKKLAAAHDPDDNRLIECADAARADYLITVNLRHFPPYWKSTKIISPRGFISLVAPHLVG